VRVVAWVVEKPQMTLLVVDSETAAELFVEKSAMLMLVVQSKETVRVGAAEETIETPTMTGVMF
jgi:hypothetical protein